MCTWLARLREQGEKLTYTEVGFVIIALSDRPNLKISSYLNLFSEQSKLIAVSCAKELIFVRRSIYPS